MFFRKREPKAPFGGETAAGPGGPSSSSTSAATGSVIGPNTRFRGEVRGTGPVVVRGQVRGTVGLANRLVVDPGGSLEADTRAESLFVAGSAEGHLQIRGVLAVAAGGTIQGSLECGRLRVEEGAFVQGRLRLLRTDA